MGSGRGIGCWNTGAMDLEHTPYYAKRMQIQIRREMEDRERELAERGIGPPLPYVPGVPLAEQIRSKMEELEEKGMLPPGIVGKVYGDGDGTGGAER